MNWPEFNLWWKRESSLRMPSGGRGPIATARAPGRLDVLGGVTDYSGGTVCQLPLARAAFCVAQRRTDGRAVGWTAAGTDAGGTDRVEIPMHALAGPRAWPAERLGPALADQGARWAGYCLGVLRLLAEEGHLPDAASSGLTLLVVSDVPLGAGVASSAAIEVAAATAITGLYGRAADALDLALLCQRVENRVVGAPCGVMDQVTAAAGREGHFLLLSCQPARIVGYEPVPAGYTFFALHSGVKHSVAGAAYREARVAAFMGHRIIRAHLAATDRARHDAIGHYLANVSPPEYRAHYRTLLPARCAGAAFLERFGPTEDSVTAVDPQVTYKVRSRTEHPIYDQARSIEFARQLASPPADEMAARLGALMYGSHWSYSHNAGLGSPETDWLVRRFRALGPAAGVFGAKITGGGGGGTVTILARSEAGPLLEQVLAEYRSRFDHAEAAWFAGTSDGAAIEGVRWLAR